jgi:hypothetical protein
MNEAEIRKNLDEAFLIIKDNLEICFKHLEKHPNETKEVLSIWKNYSNKLYKEFLSMSDKYNNNSIGKEITKMIIFK